MKSRILLFVALTACAGSSVGPMRAELTTGPASGPPGRVLVVSATCGELDAPCRNQWAPSVDQIVIAALEFRGYATIDPTTLRKDPGTRSETTSSSWSRVDTKTDQREADVMFVPTPILVGSIQRGRVVSVTESQQRTLIVDGATYDELPVEDRRALLELAGAGSVLTTRVIVGATYGTWTKQQEVEVMVKMSDARDGSMRWSARCSASSRADDSAVRAIEAAARCAVDDVRAAR